MNHSADHLRPHYLEHRQADYPVDSLFLQPWSPSAFDSLPMPVMDLLIMLQAIAFAGRVLSQPADGVPESGEAEGGQP
jgi:hypothetical protein